MIELLNKLNNDIRDIFTYDIEATKTFNVPSRNDPNLTFPIGENKNGKRIETCVLMVDIRNSTLISRKLKGDKVKLGKIYSAFIHAMATIADEYGFVRNIIGDRIMVVFEPNNCYVDAVNCALLMYTVGSRILAKYVAMEEFKIGIGIDYGEMLVLKTGLVRKHEEQSEYKGLVWIGEPANTASKLCDFANKEYYSATYKVSYEVETVAKVLDPSFDRLDMMSILLPPQLGYNPPPKYKFVTSKNTYNIHINEKEFSKEISFDVNGLKFRKNKVVNLIVDRKTGNSSAILVSGLVYNGLKLKEPKFPYLPSFTKTDYPNAPVANGGIYGGNVILSEINQIRL